MKRFLIVLMLLLATCGVALSHTSTKRKPSGRSMAGISVRGNVLHYNSAWKVVTKNDITYLFKKKAVVRQVLTVTCKCDTSGSCYMEQFPDGLRCMPKDCTGACKIVLKWVITTDPIDIEMP
jgi:hypothetical protein